MNPHDAPPFFRGGPISLEHHGGPGTLGGATMFEEVQLARVAHPSGAIGPAAAATPRKPQIALPGAAAAYL